MVSENFHGKGHSTKEKGQSDKITSQGTTTGHSTKYEVCTFDNEIRPRQVFQGQGECPKVKGKVDKITSKGTTNDRDCYVYQV